MRGVELPETMPKAHFALKTWPAHGLLLLLSLHTCRLSPGFSPGSSIEAKQSKGTKLEEGSRLTRSESLRLCESWPRPIRARVKLYRIIQCSESNAITVRISLVGDIMTQPPVPDGTTGRSIGVMLEAAREPCGLPISIRSSTSPYSHGKASQGFNPPPVITSWGFLLDAAEADRMHAGRSRVQR